MKSNTQTMPDIYNRTVKSWLDGEMNSVLSVFSHRKSFFLSYPTHKSCFFEEENLSLLYTVQSRPKIKNYFFLFFKWNFFFSLCTTTRWYLMPDWYDEEKSHPLLGHLYNTPPCLPWMCSYMFLLFLVEYEYSGYKQLWTEASWTCSCLLRSDFNLCSWEHWEHLNGWESLWDLAWMASSLLKGKALGHSSHLNLAQKSSLWRSWCFFKALRLEYEAAHLLAIQQNFVWCTSLWCTFNSLCEEKHTSDSTHGMTEQ